MTGLGKALVAIFVANSLAVVVIWWVALDADTFSAPAGGVNAAGRITGLVGTYLILVQLILRTHVPWLLRAFDKDTLKRAHAWNAYVAFALLGAHALLQFAGYALQDRVDPLTELGFLLAHYEGMLLAFAGLFLLAALTILAFDRFRHRIPWPTWRALHLYTYVAVALSVPHQIATGSDFIDAPVAVGYWTGMLAFVVAVLVAVRVPPLGRAATVAGHPHPAIIAVGALVIAAYLAGTNRLWPPASGEAPAVAQPTARGTAQSTSSSSGAVVAHPSPSLPAGTEIRLEGEAIETPYGSAQVRVVLTAAGIADVEPVLLPSATKRSKTISYSAEPWLRKRAIAAQSAEFEALSGATYTSRAYMASLESALRAAGMEHR